MKWIYGRRDFKTLEQGEENCYLMTNGLGGFSSMTMTGSVARNDHGLLMASVKAPNERRSMVHRLKERLVTETNGTKKELVLSTQEFAGTSPENGYQYLNSFTYEDTPVWRFQAGGVEIRKEAGLKQGANTIALRYEIANRGKEPCTLIVTPFFQFTPKGKDMEADQELRRKGNRLESRDLVLYFRTNGEIKEIPKTEEEYYYRYDACDGRRENGRAAADHEIMLMTEPHKTRVLELIYEMEPGKESGVDIINALKQYRLDLAEKSCFQSEPARTLAKSADQFISQRESTGGETILAGFPFFEDWGRDTMIALPGICLSAGQSKAAKQILRTFAANERGGLMPNLFPEGQNEPMYNTVDAALLFINCVYLYYQKEKDREFVKEMYPVMERIMENYKKGTEFGIRMDDDGLIHAGEGKSQVTWMDVRIGEILPTPRHGKPVEINAYWYNALCIMEELEALFGGKASGYARLGEKVKASFIEKFWMEEKGCLKDLVSGTTADEQIRCNQIWAVSMPFSMLDEEKERQVVETVFEKLYTPYGLRTLDPEDEEFKPHYGGSMMERDLAYHQGTIWPFPLGAYYLSYLKVNGCGEEAKAVVRDQLEVLESVMREGCIGQIPEIYDGICPASSKGCFAQAWSVGELLRVFEKLEKAEDTMEGTNGQSWWKEAVVYQIYPRSFQDSNGDGIGDLKGIQTRLGYLEDLGIDAIWLSPVCRSPQDDNGYDISDYQDIDPMFGSLKDMEELISQAGNHGIKIIMDLVLNHSSDEHPWFTEAKKGKDNPYHDYYVWRDGEEGTLPNDMKSVFGGPAWEWIPGLGQYYFHQFSRKQPDLNWENPSLRQEIYHMILWWMEKGVSGFRLDVIDQIAKEPDLKITNNGPRLHEFIQELSRETFQKGDLITVGEAWGADTERAMLYSNPDGSEFSMVFQFEHMMLDQQEGKEKWDLCPLPFVKLKKNLKKWQKELHGRGWNSLFWNNHDLPRIVSRWGDDKKYRKESAKMLAAVLHGMQGTPYIYQGEELGMTNVKFDSIDQYQDIEIVNMYQERLKKGYSKEEIMESIYAKGRDNARTPMQWNGGKNAGFTDGAPWLGVNPNYVEINAENERLDPDSVFHFYKKLIELRKEYSVFVNGDFELLLEEDERIFAYTRREEKEVLLVLANFTGHPAKCPLLSEWKDEETLIHNYPGWDDQTVLRPYEAVMFLSRPDIR